MQALLDLLRQLHVFLRVIVERYTHIQRRYPFRRRQRPDMQVVTAGDARKGLNVLFDVCDRYVFWHGLEEWLSGFFAERDGGLEDDGCDDERNGGIEVEAWLPGGGEPDDEGRSHDSDVSERVAEDMEEHAANVHIAMGVAPP